MNVKLKEQDVEEIRKYLIKGFTLTAIGKLFGVTRSHISNIKHGRTWNKKKNSNA